MPTKDKNRAKEIKNKIAESCEFVSADQIRITQNVKSYHSGSNRNASTGELAWWVLVEVPMVTEIKSDRYYEQNPHLTKPDESHVEEQKQNIEIIQSICSTVANSMDAEYIGYATANEGFESSNGDTRYLNIRVD